MHQNRNSQVGEGLMRANVSSKQHGFTLVELLVVIGIIAVLISILIPALGKARDSAAAAACMSNLKQMGTFLHMYANENKGICPTKAPPDSGTSYVHTLLLHRSRPTPLNDQGAYSFLRCPKADDSDEDLSRAKYGSVFGIRQNDSVSFVGQTWSYWNSYAINEGTTRWSTNPPHVLTLTKLTEIRPAANYIYAYDGRGTFRIDNGGTGTTLAIKNNIQAEIDGTPSGGHILYRHGSRKAGWPASQVNALFFDGHVEGNLPEVLVYQVDWRRSWTPSRTVAP